jgi:hypothetical protein
MRTAVQPALQYRAGVDDFLVMAADCRGVQVSLELALWGRVAPIPPSAGGEDGAQRRERGVWSQRLQTRVHTAAEPCPARWT